MEQTRDARAHTQCFPWDNDACAPARIPILCGYTSVFCWYGARKTRERGREGREKEEREEGSEREERGREGREDTQSTGDFVNFFL
jgi:hypothetical protein